MLREIQGPAGRLEALLEAPADRGVTADGLSRPEPRTVSARRWCSAIRTRSSAARCTPRACIRRPRRWRASAARCCASTSAASARATGRSTKGRRAGRLPRRARLHGRALSRRAALGGGHVVRIVGRPDRRRRGSARVGCCSASRCREQVTTSSAVAASTKPKFFIHGEHDEICVREGDPRVLRARGRAQGAGDHRRLPIICSTAWSARWPTPSKNCWETGHGSSEVHGMNEAVIVSAVRTAVGKAPNGTLRGTRPDELAATVIGEALRRAPGIDAGRDRRRDPRLRDAGGASRA